MTRPPVEAVLQAGDTETLYRRAGEGPPVLLLCAGLLAGPLGHALFEALATRFRVVAASVPAGDGTGDVLAIWLGELVEGLGLVRPSVVVDRALAGGLLDGGIADRASFAGVVAVVAGDHDDARDAARDVSIVQVPAEIADVAGEAARLAARMTPLLAGDESNAPRC